MFKDVYVFIEQREGIIQNVALELLGEARALADKLNEKVVAVLLGHNIADQAQNLIAAGADRVISAEDECLKDYTTEPYTQALTQISKANNPSIILIGATTIGRDLGPRVSARLVTGLTADCTQLEVAEDKGLLMTRPAFGGNLMATIICNDHRPQMSTVRPGVMKALAADNSRTGEIENITIDFNRAKFRVKLLKTVKSEKELVDITEANVLISGGRGVGNQEGFDKLKDLATVMAAEVSASRAMVDTGLIDHDRQVGQTGKTVRPDVYFACGISGAIQHLAGMEESELIIAINKDKDAPIFQTADLGIVGDIKTIVPMLTEVLKKQN